MSLFHRLGRWSLSLFAALGASAPIASAQEQDRREILPTPAPFGPAFIETDHSTLFQFTAEAGGSMWMASISKKASPEHASAETQGSVEIAVWAMPMQHGAEPAAKLEADDAQILWSTDPLTAGFALFLKSGEIDPPPTLFAWDEANGSFQMLGQVAGAFLGPLYGQNSSAPAPPPPLDFDLIVAALGWDAAVAEILAALYRVANSGDPEAAHAFVGLFVMLPPEAQDLVAAFLALSLQTENSPYASMVEWIVENAVPAYQSYLANQAALAATYFVLSPAAAAAASESPSSESAPFESGEWAPASFQESGREASDGFGRWEHAIALGSMGSPSLARLASLDGEEAGAREAEKSGSRNGTQEIAGARAAAKRSAEERARLLEDFLARFDASATSFAAEGHGDPAPDRPERQDLRREIGKLFATESRRRLGLHARRA